MNYATWKLNFENPEYGTGPEDAIAQEGAHAEAGWVDGVAEDGGIIIGYVSSPQDEVKLKTWDFQNITQEEALDYCLSINPEAYILEDGRITAPWEMPRF
jgi:hypothetical protein